MASQGYGAGFSVSQAAALTTLDKYRGNAADGQRIANVGAIYDALTLTRADIQGTGIVRWLTRNPGYCESFDGCDSGGRVSGGSGAIAITRSRLGAVVELSFVGQSFAQRQSQRLDDAFAQRIARGSLLFRFGPRRRTEPAVDLLAGVTLLFADTRGVTRVKGALAPTGGRHPFAVQTRATGLIGGVDLSLPVTRTFGLVVPLRVTRVLTLPLTTWPGKLDVQAGIGMSVRVMQRVR